MFFPSEALIAEPNRFIGLTWLCAVYLCTLPNTSAYRCSTSCTSQPRQSCRQDLQDRPQEHLLQAYQLDRQGLHLEVPKGQSSGHSSSQPARQLISHSNGGAYARAPPNASPAQGFPGWGGPPVGRALARPMGMPMGMMGMAPPPPPNMMPNFPPPLPAGWSEHTGRLLRIVADKS